MGCGRGYSQAGAGDGRGWRPDGGDSGERTRGKCGDGRARARAERDAGVGRARAGAAALRAEYSTVGTSDGWTHIFCSIVTFRIVIRELWD